MPQSIFGDDRPQKTGKSRVGLIVVGLLVVLGILGYLFLK